MLEVRRELERLMARSAAATREERERFLAIAGDMHEAITRATTSGASTTTTW